MFFAKVFKTLKINLMFISFGFNLLLVIISSSPATSKLKEISFRVPPLFLGPMLCGHTIH